MIDLSKKLGEWAKSLPAWQQHSLKQIWNRRVSEAEKNMYMECIKRENLLLLPRGKFVDIPKVDFDFFPKSTKKGEEVLLQALFDLRNVNAVSENSILNFGWNGVTVIYGQNGSGKSGFARVLKNACRARGEQQKILPNIFKPIKDISAEAKFLISISDKKKELQWVDGETNFEDLRKIAVFDNHAARFYIDEENLVYVPYGLDIFQGLVSLCKELQGNFKEDYSQYEHLRFPDIFKTIEYLNKDFQDCVTTLRKLSEKSTYNDFFSAIKSLNKVSVFFETEDEELKKLEKKLQEDPANKAKTKDNFKKRLQACKDLVKEIQDLFLKENIEKMGELYLELMALKKEFEKSSKELFQNEPLKEIGGEEWQAMYEKAEEYSKIVYPDKKFPAKEKDCVCLLCQQEIQEVVVKRFERFEKFMDTQKKSDSFNGKRKTYVFEWNKYKTLKLNDFKPDPVLAKEIKEFIPNVHESIEDFFDEVTKIQKSLEKGISPQDSWSKIVPLSIDLVGILEKTINSLNDDIGKLLEAADSDKRKTIEDQMEILKARKCLKDNKKMVLSYLVDLWRKKALFASIKSIQYGQITKKGRELIGLCVTSELKKALKKEQEDLGADNIPIKIDDFGELGKTFSKLEFEKCCLENKQNLSTILSEGEQKIIAIASFLSELKAGKQTCGIVFDDPVSSLDHRWKEIVAKRLVKESSERQVIIFTHDITFFLEIQNQVCKMRARGLLLMVAKEGRQTGVVNHDSLPWGAKNTSKKMSYVRKKFSELKKQFKDRIEAPEYKDDVYTIYDLLRKSWESAVEECLFCGVIRRFDSNIKTKLLREVTIEESDYTTVFNGMSECSKWVHESPAAKQGKVPDVKQIEENISDLEKYIKSLSERRKKNDKERYDCEKMQKCDSIDIEDLKKRIMQRKQAKIDENPPIEILETTESPM